ncbi:MAG: ABC transporter permease [Rhizobiaceae bacterium]|nr:ABC transporter permease [Rhizobiaceae bacterium]
MATAAPARRWRGVSDVVRRIARDPMGLLGLVLVALFLLVGLGADWLAPFDPIKVGVARPLSPPSWLHPLGTDQLGRDLFSRVIVGSRIALAVAGASILVAVSLGVTMGLAAGYGPRWLDNATLLVFDVVYSFPMVMFGLAIVTLTGPGLWVVVMVVVAALVPSYGRIMRTATLSLKNNEFIMAERSMGARTPRILLRHILPNAIGPVFILASMDIPAAIAFEAGLTFLGIGLRPPAPSWGRILNEGYVFIQQTPWIIIAGGIPLVLATLGFTFLGEALRDTLDPKLRRRR